MIINKYTGKTEEEAKAKAREDLGTNVVIMNVKEVRPKGLFGAFKNSTYEVTAAVEEDSRGGLRQTPFNPNNQASGFNAVVDDSVQLSKNAPSSTTTDNVNVKGGLGDFAADLHSDDLMEAFKAVNEVINKSEEKVESPEEQAFKEPPIPSSSYSEDIVPLASISPTLYTKESLQKANEKKAKVKEEKQSSQEAELEAKLSAKSRNNVTLESRDEAQGTNHAFIKTLYNILMDNEVQEKYINQVLDDMDRVLANNHSIDSLLSSVYQKMVLKLGTPEPIKVLGKRPKIVFFIGPTGVGKTTTIAKIAAKLKLEEKKSVSLITTDTYRMAATDQLRNYASIMEMPLEIVYTASEMNDAIKRHMRSFEDTDVILVDTIGFSHKNEGQKEDVKALLSSVDDVYDKSVYLVLSATTKYRDLLDITDSYSEFTRYNLIFTKLDETACYGNIYNIKQKTAAPLSYVCAGQNVPDDIEVVNTQKLVKNLLGG